MADPLQELYDTSRAAWESAQPKTWTWTYIRLCSAFNVAAGLTCDQEAGHGGPHSAHLLWNAEGEDDS